MNKSTTRKRRGISVTSGQDEEQVHTYTRREGDGNKTSKHKFKQINKRRKKLEYEEHVQTSRLE